MTARPLSPMILSVLLAAGCDISEEAVHQPTLSEVSAEGDAAVSLIDRAAVLADAVEDEAGEAPVLSGAAPGFYMEIDSADMADALDEAEVAHEGSAPPPPPGATYRNVLAAGTALVWADVATLAVVGPPSAAIAVAASGELTEVTPWLWSATNTVTGPQGESATVDLNVAWIGVGWLAEMRLSSSDGRYDDTLWFNGFLAVGGGVGWWDIYHEGEVAAVVEWIADGAGNGQAGIAALGGGVAGDALSYLHTAEGDFSVAYYDASEDFLNYAILYADNSGEVALINREDGAPGCWGADWADTDCPTE